MRYHSLLFLLATALAPALHAAELAVLGGVRVGGQAEVIDADSEADLDGGAHLSAELGLDYDATGRVLFLLDQERFRIRGEDFEDADVRITALQFGGSRYWRAENAWQPYTSAAIGVHLLEADGYDDEVLPGFSIAGGVLRPLTDHLGLRMELRLMGTVTDGSGSILCQGGDCAVRLRGSGLTRVGVAAGFYARF